MFSAKINTAISAKLKLSLFLLKMQLHEARHNHSKIKLLSIFLLSYAGRSQK
jgi:hypothetical protein